MLSKQRESATALFTQVFNLKTVYFNVRQMERETTFAGGSAVIHSKLNQLRITLRKTLRTWKEKAEIRPFLYQSLGWEAVEQRPLAGHI